MTALRIATRRSDLAMAQAGIVRLLLKEQGRDAVLLPVDTLVTRRGSRAGPAPARTDRSTPRSSTSFGPAKRPRGALRQGPPRGRPGGPRDRCRSERGDPRDVLVAGDGAYFDGDGPRRGARVGTSSLRRAAQLRATFPGVEIVDLHGNVPTRLRKLHRRRRPGRRGPGGGRARPARSLHPTRLKPLPVDVAGARARTGNPRDPVPHRRPAAASGLVGARARRVGHHPARRARANARARRRLQPTPRRVRPGHGDVIHLAACVATPDGSRVVRATSRQRTQSRPRRASPPSSSTSSAGRDPGRRSRSMTATGPLAGRTILVTRPVDRAELVGQPT